MSKRIMVIDDAKAMRDIVTHVLTGEGYETVQAIDGQDALGKLDGQQIDMFICDVNMPNMDGLTFLKNVKNEKQYSSYRFAPVIMLTTETGEDMRAKGESGGASAWLVKPFQPPVLISAVKKLMPN